MWFIHLVKYYSVTHKCVPQHERTSKPLFGDKNKLSQRVVYCVIPFICNSKATKLIYGDMKRISVAEVKDELQKKNVRGHLIIMKMGFGKGNISVYICQNSLNYILKMEVFLVYIVPE